MNISAKNAARIKIKYSFAIYMNGAYRKCPNSLLYVIRKLWNQQENKVEKEYTKYSKSSKKTLIWYDIEFANVFLNFNVDILVTKEWLNRTDGLFCKAVVDSAGM